MSASDIDPDMVVPNANLNLAAANRMLDAAEKRARELGFAGTFAVVDSGGHLIAFRRMDGCGVAMIQIAMDKATTAITHRIDTDTLARYYVEKHDKYPTLLESHEQLPHTFIVPGGNLVHTGDGIVGAIGTSGGPSVPGEEDADVQACKAAIAALSTSSAWRGGPSSTPIEGRRRPRWFMMGGFIPRQRGRRCSPSTP